MSPDERIARIASRQHGVFTARQAHQAGLTPHQIAHRRRTKRWTHLHTGVYAINGSMQTDEQRITAAVLSFGHIGVAGSITAAWVHGLTQTVGDLVYVVLPTGQHRRARLGIVARESGLVRSDVQRIRSIPVTATNRSLVDLARDVPQRSLEAALDAAVLGGRTSITALQTYVQRRRFQHNAGVGVLAQLLRDRLDGVPESELERVFLRKLQAARVPPPVRQFRIGRRRIDFAYPDRRVAVELDGVRYHTGAAFRLDRQRQNELIVLGWTILRFTWDDVTGDWLDVERILRKTLGLANS